MRNRWAESFELFADAGLGDYDVSAEHDVIYVECRQLTEDSLAGQRLQQLGWFWDSETDGWAHYV